MINKDNIHALLFDYGGTIDTNGLHWAEVIWQAYTALNVPVGRDDFRNAYVYGERYLATHPTVHPNHNFWHVLHLKAKAQLEYITGNIPQVTVDAERLASEIADWCYAYAQSAVNAARPVLKQLADKYPLVLVSNFYGNLRAVIDDFRIDGFFTDVVESAVVGVCKPDPEIFRLGVKATGFAAEETAVVGDSYTEDIVPAGEAGCQTIWLKRTGWEPYSGNETADLTIEDFTELECLL
jgi:putative hydrolase of the HAD superfamily